MIPRTDKRKLTKRIIHPGAPIDPQTTATMIHRTKSLIASLSNCQSVQDDAANPGVLEPQE